MATNGRFWYANGMSPLVTIIRTCQSIMLGMAVGFLVAPANWTIFEPATPNSVEFSALATLRLVITPPEVAKPSPVSNIESSVRNMSIAPTPPQTVDLRPARASDTPAIAAKSAGSNKCFDDLLSLSLGDDEPSSKERARKTKC
jgi:hypothetical protein